MEHRIRSVVGARFIWHKKLRNVFVVHFAPDKSGGADWLKTGVPQWCRGVHADYADYADF